MSWSSVHEIGTVRLITFGTALDALRRAVHRLAPTSRESMSSNVRLRLAIGLWIGLAGCACSSSPSSPTPMQSSQYGGTWVGLVRSQQCVVGGVQTSCRLIGWLPVNGGGFVATLTQQRGNIVTGTLNTCCSARFTVSGGVDPDGSLSLTGTGLTSSPSTFLTITEWRTRETNGVMAGSFTYSVRETATTLTFVLENVVRQ